VTNRILVVDDEPGIRFAFRQYFGKKGFQVDSAATVKEARTLIALHHYGLAILDLHLTNPRDHAEGFDLAVLLRENAPETAIIILSASEAPEAEQKAVECGVHSYLKKPARLSKVAEVAFGLL
jgi:DNA-binding response OmpR family regulator